MLRLSKSVDYALMALVHLSRLPQDESASARELARHYAIPYDLLAKILQRLAQSQLVASSQGTRGGYRLARAAEAISAAEVIEAIDGSLSLVQCFTDTGSCDQFDHCNIKSPIQSLNDQVLQLLTSVSLAEMRDRESHPAHNASGDEADNSVREGEIRLPVVS